jgi:hypothetical protein
MGYLLRSLTMRIIFNAKDVFFRDNNKTNSQLLPQANGGTDVQEHRHDRRIDRDSVVGFARVRASGRRGDERSIEV